MTSKQIFLPLSLASLLALAFVPTAAASPCATPCGQVQVVLDCLTVTVTAEGAGGSATTAWSFVVYESWNYGGGRTHRDSSTGPVATFTYTNTVPSHFIYYVDAYLYANGDLVAESHWGCYNG